MSGVFHENFISTNKVQGQHILLRLLKKLLINSNPVSSLGIKNPSLRNHPLKSGSVWLEGKKIDDKTEGLWRIHDSLYDFTEFVENHPGGSDWLKLTKGTDITEAFECHHLTTLPANLLSEFFVKHASTPRHVPFTFKEDGFYMVLKKEISETIKTIPTNPINRSKVLTDVLLIFYIGLALLAVYFKSYCLGVLSGVTLCFLANAAHNFFHQKDNFRMYYFDLTMMQSKEWRISHALSHHLYPNTVLDVEVSSLEPFLQYLPNENMLLFRYVSWIYSPIVYVFMFLGQFIRIIGYKYVLGSSLEWTQFLPFTVPIAMYLTTGESLVNCLVMFTLILTVGSLVFGLIGVSAAHHHPDIFHDGDATRPIEEMDWGIFQLDAVMDRKDITGSHFLVLTNYGDHALHHLFPTIDHGQLEYLYPVFLKACEKFGLEWRSSSTMELTKGQFRQLIKIKPNNKVPGSTKSNE